MIYDALKGDRGKVYLDGIEIEKAARCKTGFNGWVEVLMYVDGQPEKLACGRIARSKKHGHVRFERNFMVESFTCFTRFTGGRYT